MITEGSLTGVEAASERVLESGAMAVAPPCALQHLKAA
jgi:hypothetical protein